MESTTRADLHVHSKYSDRPAEWFLRRVGAPECFVEPSEVYQRAREAGMDFVTIADHNTINGALEIAHLADTFISVEVTTYFPEDGCKVHCLVAGIDERQFQMIQELRASIYELREYVEAEGLFCAVNHPLYRVNGRLTVAHLEKLLVMFNRFEAINGSRDLRSAAVLRAVLASLTPELLGGLAECHRLEPCGPEPWVKRTTGGSDDHSGAHIGSAYTVAPAARSAAEYLAHLHAGRHAAGGAAGGSLLLAQSLYHIAASYYRQRFLRSPGGRPSLLGELLERLARPLPPTGGRRWARLVPGFAKRYFVNRKLRQLGDIERLLAAELPQLLARENQARPAASATTDGRRAFQSVARVAHLLGYSLLGKLQGEFREGRWLEVLQTAASMGAVTLGVVPYLAAFATQHKDDGLLAAVAARFPRARPALTDGGKAWLTDTWGETDNDALAVEAVAAEAAVAGRRLTCVTCRDGVPPTAMRLHNFAPVGELELPECDRPRLWFPPFLETIEWLEQQGFHELIVATPGPLGMAGLGAAKLLGLSVSGVYQTDLPRHVGQITRDPAMEELTWKFLRWFYGQMDRVLVPSECYRRHLAANGFDRQRLRVAGHGVDPQQFQPGRRDPRFNARWGLRGAFTFLFAGRVAAETNIELLLGEFARLRSTLPQVNLAVVGDGPLLDALRSRYRGLHVAFTGPLRGEALATAYASADALVVPSRTLRFAPAVLEAQAAGLPAIVSDWGDPRDIVEQGGSGMMVNVQCPGALASAMHRMATHPAEHAHWRRAATAHAHRHTWRRVVERIWADEPPAPPPCDRGAPESVAELIALDVA